MDKNIHFEYSLVLPHQGSSNEYCNIYLWRNKKKLKIVSGKKQGPVVQNLMKLLAIKCLNFFLEIWQTDDPADPDQTAECDIQSGSTLFATCQTVLHTFTGSIMDLLKRR